MFSSMSFNVYHFMNFPRKKKANNKKTNPLAYSGLLDYNILLEKIASTLITDKYSPKEEKKQGVA